jgi:hypothetical protein
LVQNSSDEFITEFETLLEFFFWDDGVFYLATKEVFGEKEIEIILIDITDNEDIDEVVCRFTSHILETATDDEEWEIVFATEIFIEFFEGIEAFSKIIWRSGSISQERLRE